MKVLRTFLVLFFYSTLIFAQQTDSIRFAQIKWTSKKITKGTQLYTAHLTDSSLFNSNQNLMFIEVKKQKNSPHFAFGYEESKLIPTSIQAEKLGAVAAINGTFFDMKNGGSVDYLKVAGKEINENNLGKVEKRTFHQKSAIVLKDGYPSIKKWDGTRQWEKDLKETDIMTCGPLLLLNHQKEKLDSISFNNNRHPRSAMGIKADGTVLIFAVDGRSKYSNGMSLHELSAVMKWLGCIDAVNLDGGGSTTLWVKGFDENGVINYPSDNKKWDHQGERKVANIVYLKDK